MKTREDLIKRTLELLNAIAAGQTPEAEDVQTIDELMDGKLEELSIREIAFFPDKDQFDEFYIDPLAIILANTAAPGFGQPRNPDSVFTAEAKLQAFKPSTYVPGSTMQTDYF